MPESEKFVFDDLPTNIFEAIKKISEETSLDALDFGSTEKSAINRDGYQSEPLFTIA